MWVIRLKTRVPTNTSRIESENVYASLQSASQSLPQTIYHSKIKPPSPFMSFYATLASVLGIHSCSNREPLPKRLRVSESKSYKFKAWLVFRLINSN